MLIEVR